MSRLLTTSGALAALCLGLLSVQSGSAAADAPAEGAQVVIKTINGSGCPAGTAGATVSPDNSTLTVKYDAYTARAGGNAGPTEARKNCQLVLDVKAPASYTYALFGLDHRGHASLPAGATATIKSDYYFQGTTDDVLQSHPLTGPYEDDWAVSDSVPENRLVWAPCGSQRYLNVNTSLRVRAGSGNSASVVTMGSTDVPGTSYRLIWKRCA
ncbi:DUF4360 domain-containing protein [Streptomyces sp. ATCC 21386]|uniref:DUF4360 domain-containing protein n=1 Tax=Streptomyces sp. ATCC 21386 TaxID=2699428 RepID=UPI001BFF824F|nr:DUF4360 domain-containing protein [Streptomyces sp. ATCC 21386]